MVDQNFFYKKDEAFSLQELLLDLECEVADDIDANLIMITDVAPLVRAGKGEISFFSNLKYKEDLKSTKATAVIVEEANLPLVPDATVKIISSNPYALYAEVVARIYPQEKINTYKADSAFVSPSAEVGENCYIGPGAVIDANTTIGDGCYIGAHTYISRNVTIGENSIIKQHCTLQFCHVGKNVMLHPGVRIGQDGFGFANKDNTLIKVRQLGRVIIGDNVEIGANSCIDRGTIDDTVIGDGTKIDNLVQIGHNVTTGRSCIFVAQVGVAGSTTIGDGVVLGGQVGISGHITIGSGAMVAAQSGVIKDVAPKAVMGGYPAVPVRQWHRQSAVLREMTAREDK